MLRLAVAAGSWLLFSVPACAYCSEPSAPYCATSFGEFASQFEFDMCRSDLERYSQDVERFIECVATQAQGEQSDAIDEYNDAIESFNRRASGG